MVPGNESPGLKSGVLLSKVGASHKKNETSYRVNPDVYYYQKRLESALRRVRDSQDITPEDKQSIERFCKVLRIQNISTGRLQGTQTTSRCQQRKLFCLASQTAV